VRHIVASVVLVLVACVHQHPVARANDITRRSHEVLEAFDRGDVKALRATLSPQFVQFEGGSPRDVDALVARIATRGPAGHVGQRSWEKEQVIAKGDAVVFVGQATEVQAGNTVHGGYRYVGWYVLEWRRDREGAWKLALWTWQRAGDGEERDWWNDVFRNGVGFSKAPNRLLVDSVKAEKPGAALDVAMGQGRNALYLASQGWHVTGVDMSDVGIRQAREEASRRGLALETVDANLDTYDFGTERYDLVTMIYAGNDAAWIDKAKRSLKPHGLFVLEYFADDKPTPKLVWAGDLAKVFDGYEIVRNEIVEDTPDWAMDRAKLVRFVARKR
jgi:SAM-dependent methyltransferase